MHRIGVIHWIGAVGGANGTPWWWCVWGELCCCLTDYSYYSYSRKSTGREFFVPARTLIMLLIKRVVVIWWCHIRLFFSKPDIEIPGGSKTDENFWRVRLRWLMFTNRFDNHKSIWAISVKYQSDAKWVGEQKGIIHFCLNSIAANLFIIRRSRTILNHGLSSLFFAPARNFYVRFGKKQSYVQHIMVRINGWTIHVATCLKNVYVMSDIRKIVT